MTELDHGIRVVSTPQLLRALDESESFGVDMTIPADAVAQLDGAANHVLMLGGLVADNITPSRPDVVIARVGLKYINSSFDEPSASYYIELPEATWDWLPVHQV